MKRRSLVEILGLSQDDAYNDDGRHFVIIGNYGRGDQVAWPETDNPGLYTEKEALRIADDQNEMHGAPAMGWQRRAHWHVKRVQDAHKYAPDIFSASPPYIIPSR